MPTFHQVPDLGTLAALSIVFLMHKTIYSEQYRSLLSWLKECRKSNKLSMRAVARKMKVPHTWVGKVEQAERRLDIAEFVKLCEAMNVNPHDGLDLLLSNYAKPLFSQVHRARLIVDKRRS